MAQPIRFRRVCKLIKKGFISSMISLANVLLKSFPFKVVSISEKVERAVIIVISGTYFKALKFYHNVVTVLIV